MVALLFASFALAGSVFFAVVPLADFAPLLAGVAPVVFFSPTLPLAAGAPVGPVGFLVAAALGVLALTAAGGVFLDTPLVCGLELPFERRLWDVLGLGAGVVLVRLVVLGLDLAVVLLAVLALDSPEVLLPVLAGGVSLVWSGWGPSCSAGCCGISSSVGLAAWLGSCSPAATASFIGLDSNVSICSRAAVTTPSGFISLRVAVVRLCSAGRMDLNTTG